MNLSRAVKLVPASEAGGLHSVELANGATLKARSDTGRLDDIFRKLTR